jgi:hypothetical protein
MSHEDDIKTALAADVTLAAILTGGFFTYDDTGRLGLSLDGTPTAFAATGLLKPCCVVKQRTTTPDGRLADEGLQEMSYVAVVEIWLYNDGDSAITALENASNRIYTLLQDSRVTGSKVRWIFSMENERAPELDGANLWRDDYEVIAIRS